ncbi:MAG: GNAT family N-acetyltransferase [Bacteroidota bacterium]|nr:GNAT family N-acetyltransferase [Bacteroidota bacterium]
MNIIIREAISKDMSKVLELIKELATFEKEPDAVIVTEKQLINDGFSSSPKFKCFVAEINQEIVGMALGYPRYSTWKGPTIHLEDLIVTKNKRGLGIGFKLYSKFLHYAFKLDVKRVEWAVLDWNKNAIDFYKRSGAKILNDWSVVQMDHNAIKKFIKNENI